MAFTIAVDHNYEYLLVSAAGPARLADMYGYMDLVATVAANTNKRRAVLDLREVEIAFSFTDHLNLGVYASERLHQLKRVASVVAPASRTGTSERAAQQMGLQLRTFTSWEEGLQWINQ